eukprot:4678014-Pyramimonas_sp.AAC.1
MRRRMRRRRRMREKGVEEGMPSSPSRVPQASLPPAPPNSSFLPPSSSLLPLSSLPCGVLLQYVPAALAALVDRFLRGAGGAVEGGEAGGPGEGGVNDDEVSNQIVVS